MPFQSKTGLQTPAGEEIPADARLFGFRRQSRQTCAESSGCGAPWLADFPRSPPRWLFGRWQISVPARCCKTSEHDSSKNKSKRIPCEGRGRSENLIQDRGSLVRIQASDHFPASAPISEACFAGHYAQMDPRIDLGSPGIDGAT